MTSQIASKDKDIVRSFLKRVDAKTTCKLLVNSWVERRQQNRLRVFSGFEWNEKWVT